MYQRKVIKTGNSLCIGIPREVSKKLKLEKGEDLIITDVEGHGFFVYKEETSGVLPTLHKEVAELNIVKDNILTEIRRVARATQASFTFNFMNRMMGDLIRAGIIKIDYERVQDEVHSRLVEGMMKSSIHGVQDATMRHLKIGPFSEKKGVEDERKLSIVGSKKGNKS